MAYEDILEMLHEPDLPLYPPHCDEDRPSGLPWEGYYYSAYGIAVKHGYVGTEEEWLASLKGNTGDKGEKGDGITAVEYNDDGTMTVTYGDGETATSPNLKGAKGDTGDPGANGDPGNDGVSPSLSSSAITGGHKVTMTDATHTEEFNVMDGEDGVSPVLSETSIPGGHRVTVTDAQGTRYFDVMDGGGSGDMISSVYDADSAVASAGGIAAYVEENGGKIDTIKKNGTALPITDKAVDISVPTDLSELSADSTHRLVTDTEKAAWNSKQEAISDIATIRIGAALGATAVQPSALSGYIPTSQKGAASGVAELGSDGKVPTTQLPSIGGYTKAETLTAATAALYGLGSSAVPDDVFAWLGNYTLHTWRRRTVYKTINKSQITSNRQITSVSTAKVIKYSSDLNADKSLVNPQEISIPCSLAGAELVASLAPCYISDAQTAGVYYVPSGATWGSTATSETIFYSPGQQYVGMLSVGNPRMEVVTSVTVVVTGEWELVFSANRSEYPDSGISGGYEWEYVGIPFDNAASVHTKIATGKYVGTGTYGSDHPNSIVCPFIPKFIWVVYRSSASARSSMLAEANTITLIALDDVTTTPKQYFGLINGVSENNCYGYKSDDGKTFSWYQTYTSNYPARYQLNESAYTYRWIAIG